MIDIETFIRERDELLLTGDVDKCTAFMLKHNPAAKPPANRTVAEIMMHKAITGAPRLPMAYRVKSYAWLIERGYSSLDDGDVRAAYSRQGQ